VEQKQEQLKNKNSKKNKGKIKNIPTKCVRFEKILPNVQIGKY